MSKIFYEVESEFVLANAKIKTFGLGSGIQDMALWDELNKELEFPMVFLAFNSIHRNKSQK